MFGSLFKSKSEEEQRRELLNKDFDAYVDKYKDDLTKEVKKIEYPIRFVTGYSENYTYVSYDAKIAVTLKEIQPQSYREKSQSDNGLMIYCEEDGEKCRVFYLPISSISGWYNNNIGLITFTDEPGVVIVEVTVIYDKKLGNEAVYSHKKTVEYKFNRNTVAAMNGSAM